jgi:hypothetical protein
MAKYPRIFLYALLVLLLAGGCSTAQSSLEEATVEDLIAIISVSDPASPLYESAPSEFAAFGEATDRLQAIGDDAAPAAPLLAHALAFPRRDSYAAARPLVALGPLAASALPVLIGNLPHERPDVRSQSAYVLGTIGPLASCAVPQLAPLLWDTDPFVRTSAAAALDAITGQDLVGPSFELSLDPASAGSVFADEPPGSISGAAREWWIRVGSSAEWGPTHTVCDP